MLKQAWQRARRLGSGPIARASAVGLVIRVAGLALSFAQAVLTARLLGAGGYGTVAVALAVVQIAATVCLFGFGPLAVREIPARAAAGDTAGAAAFLHHAILSVLALSVVAGIGIVLVSGSTEWISPDYRMALELGGLLVAPFALIAMFRGAAQGFGRVALAQAPGELVRPAAMVFLMGVIALLGLSFSPVDFMWTAIGAATLAAIAAGALLWRNELSILPSPHRTTEARRYIVNALPFLGIGLTGLFDGEINTLVLGWFASPHETGLFQPLMRLTAVLAMPIAVTEMRFAPRIAELWERRETDRLRSVTLTFTLTTWLLTSGIALVIAATGPWLLWAFGPAFRETAPLLWMIAAAQVFNSACGPVGILLMMSGKSSWALAGRIGGLAVNATLGILLIPIYGVWGAAFAVATSIVVWNVALLAMTKVHCGFDPSLLGILFRSSISGRFRAGKS
jgi:O-antigen/teichoic acid export membrane protein